MSKPVSFLGVLSLYNIHLFQQNYISCLECILFLHIVNFIYFCFEFGFFATIFKAEFVQLNANIVTTWDVYMARLFKCYN